MGKINFKECPNPQFVRDNWISLDGRWDFRFDRTKDLAYYSWDYLQWKNGFEKEYDIMVPFSYQSKNSGINITDRFDSVWYQRHITINKEDDKRYILHLEGADYYIKVYVNGNYVGSDTGAYHRMSFDLTDYIVEGDNLIVINCKDDYSVLKPRGKQRWRDNSFDCFYVDTTGIYKSVWLEIINKKSLKEVNIIPSLDDANVLFELAYDGDVKGLTLNSKVSFDDKELINNKHQIKDNNESIKLDIPSPLHLWEIGKGNLYDVTFELIDNDNKIIDKVESYFGLRKIEAKDGQVLLNGKPIYQKLVLDQGYWEDSDLTPPSNEALYNDIDLMLQAGFNGCRKHQKFEDERFIYYCDVLGFLMWGEMPSCYAYSPTSALIFEREWLLEMKQMRNHPSIITWTIFNESWGVQEIKTNKEEQEFVNKMVRLTKEIDNTRLVISNDGWEHTKSDLLTIHHYEQDPKKFYDYFSTIEKCIVSKYENHYKGPYSDGYGYEGQPIIMSEFGGTAFVDEDAKNWGYGSKVKTKEEYVNRLDGLFKALQDNKHIVGYCFTQVSDVQQEINGLLTYDRKCKVDLKLIKQIQDRRN